MKTKVALALALTAAAITAGTTLAPLAKEWRQDGSRKELHFRNEGQGGAVIVPRGDRDLEGGDLLARICSERGAGPLDDMFKVMDERIAFSPEQHALFETFRETAHTAQAEFVTACTELNPLMGETETLDLADRLRLRLGLETARLTALNAVLPAFEAFYQSLGDGQKRVLEPVVPTITGRPSSVIEPRAPRSTGPYDI